jgi:tetratricopeptide (TPR) repeat protein
MFNLFKAKPEPQPELPITTEDKEWVEGVFIWFGIAFGFDRLKEIGFLLPTAENFPANVEPENEAFEQLFLNICNVYELDPNDIVVRFFENTKWTTWAPMGETTVASGKYYEAFTESSKRYHVSIDKAMFDDYDHLIAVLAHELAHVKLLGGRFIERDHPEMEPINDLATIYFGYGIYTANASVSANGYWAGKNGYLPPQVIAYALALISKIKDEKEPHISEYLNTNCRELFQKSLEWLWEKQDTTLTTEKIAECNEQYVVLSGIDKAYDERDYQKAIDLNARLFKGDKTDATPYNTRGYSKLMLGKYEEAINDFNEAIMLDPYWDYPYNNRGYCYLMLGQLEEGFVDSDSSFNMNPNNSFSHRNLGVYHLLKGDLSKAKEFLETALNMDPKTDLIRYHLGLLYLKSGEREKAINEFEKSSASGEPEGKAELAKLQ